LANGTSAVIWQKKDDVAIFGLSVAPMSIKHLGERLGNEVIGKYSTIL
jgi:hypothetical protein